MVEEALEMAPRGFSILALALLPPHRWKEAQAAACIQLPHFPRCAQLIGSPQVLVLQTPLSRLGRQVVNETSTQLSEGKGVEKASWLPSAKVLEGSEGGLPLGE